MHEVRGVVAKGRGEPVSVETIVVPDPGPGETLVRVQACGVCHTDLHYREGAINDDFPFLLGHEAAGVVEAVGPDVTEVEPGDFVVLNWRAVCGTCRSCRRGRPWYCFSTFNATQKMTLDGVPLSPALGIGAFAEKTLVAAGQATRVDPAARPEAAGLLGCGVMAGYGAAVHTGEVTRGDTVAVFGCGGVGDAAIAGARLAGARTIIAVDLDPTKLEWATRFGATHTVDASTQDPVEAVRALTEGNGADVCIEAVGHPEVLRQAFFARDLAGTVVQVGVPNPEMTFPDIPMIEFFGRGGALKPSWYGDCLPSRDFPLLVDLYLQGRFDLEGFVSETIPLDGVEEAFHRMERGEVLRSVVVL
ncbi:MAG: S-(hydroxymethyl)mycothiol dehydrogenase [Acidimicrobiales bacterium]|jgi:S-(hydroxymethyl)mycothiol dehydrogenase|nr:S-(hydroxymethyl)mycothiol dehydrogenase [Acidimicrobiales bacterium]